ncbi:methyl-accepting chemotaxis protein [Zymobacter palmae]|uniref:Methyl-accepting chemotaxis protein n=2 Tax=Zymobacter palmae TaxID=33074 RepID=A0A348HB99_9GAMM|nr:methyl-accepting chemotaxis protein [Zymobacter palmae]BBG28901.1 methyl-accepting chemotaxis protein [Zymobacter palmae]
MKLANLRLSMRLGATFAVLLGILLILMVTVLNGMSSVRSGMNEILDVRVPGTRFVNRLNNAVQSMRIGEIEALQYWNDARMRDPLLKSFSENPANVTEALSRYRALPLSDIQRQRLQTLEDSWNRILVNHQAIITMLDHQQYKEASAKAIGEQRDQFRQMNKIFDDLYAAEKARSTEVSVNVRGTLSNATTVMILGSIIALLFAVAAGFLLSRYFRLIFDQLIAASQRIARGDLSHKIEGTDLTNEVGDLLRAMDDMQKGLSVTVAAVRRNADHVASASAQIAQGNQDLSSRTEQQASALEETASAMEELGSTVKQNASNAQNADNLAQEAAKVAHDGGQVVERVVHRMNDLNDGAQKIVDIISLIDSIAFQTNLLALNASIEAARAGEQGRGFAVVASEVRNLAQRSADASRQISGLINESVTGIREGTSLVGDAGKAMHNVTDVITRLTDIMSEISSASHEQSEGVSQVGTAVVQMDQMTQQNAALVEESASAAANLHQQAADMVELVRVFEVGDVEDDRHGKPTMATRKISTTTSSPKAHAKTEPSVKHSAPSAEHKTPAKDEPVLTSSSDDDWETF